MNDDFFDNENENLNFKLSKKKNVISINSFIESSVATSEENTNLEKPINFENIILDLQNQLSSLSMKLSSEDVSPEFKTLMEGYVKKANEAEELKVKFDNINNLYAAIKSDIEKLRETNRELTAELQEAREELKKIELQFSFIKENNVKSEHDQNERIKEVKKKQQEIQEKLNKSEEEKHEVKKQMEKRVLDLIKNQENLKQEISDMDFDFRQKERELINEIDSLNKKLKESERIIKEQQEKLDFKTKEADYKATLLNQISKQMTTEDEPETYRSRILNNMMDEGRRKNKKRFWL